MQQAATIGQLSYHLVVEVTIAAFIPLVQQSFVINTERLFSMNNGFTFCQSLTLPIGDNNFLRWIKCLNTGWMDGLRWGLIHIRGGGLQDFTYLKSLEHKNEVGGKLEETSVGVIDDDDAKQTVAIACTCGATLFARRRSHLKAEVEENNSHEEYDKTLVDTKSGTGPGSSPSSAPSPLARSSISRTSANTYPPPHW